MLASGSCPKGRGFPTDLPVVGCGSIRYRHYIGRGFPTDLPVVGSLLFVNKRPFSRGFPTDLPVVGYHCET